MIYEAKSYLYYKLLDLTEYSFKNKFEEMIKSFGDFDIKPGSIKDIKDDRKFVTGISCDELSFKNSAFTCLHFSFNRISGCTTINGTLDDTPISVKLNYDKKGCLDKYTINISDVNSGLYIINYSHYDDSDDLQRIAYYDQVAIQTLLHSYNISYLQLHDIHESDIERLGIIKPDCKKDFDEHQLNKNGNDAFIKELFHDTSWSKLQKTLSEIIKEGPTRGARTEK